jgi:hypothetical protein
MKSMLAVTQLITQQKLRKIDVLSEDMLNAKNSKFRELYLGLRDGSIRSDREAASKLYDSDPSDARYRQLKSRFKKRLLNTLFFVDQSKPHRSSFDQTYHNCQRDWSLINILRQNDVQEPAVQMARSLLTVCQKYGFAELTVQTARFLANEAADKSDFKTAKQLQLVIDQANQSFQLELKGEDILRRARMLLTSSGQKNDPTKIQAEVQALQIEIEAIQTTSESAVLYYNRLEANCLLARTIYEKEKVIRFVDEVIAYSAVSPRQMHETRLVKLCMWQIELLIEKRDQVRGLEAIAHLASRCRIGSDIWFTLQKSKLALLLKSKAFAEAQRVADAVMKHRSFSLLSPQETEIFRLLEMLTICFDATLNANVKHAQHGKIQAFLKKEANFRTDCQGLNAWRYLIKATLYRILGQTKELGDTIAAFRHLSVKQLCSKHDTRLIAMSQLLYRMERKHFTGELDRVGERYFKQLREIPFQCGLQANAFTPIDVEDLLAFFGVNELAELPA